MNNNSGGEKSLEYGKTEDYVTRIKTVLSDGNEYELRPLAKNELKEKMNKNDFEGQIYSKMYKLITENYEVFKLDSERKREDVPITGQERTQILIDSKTAIPVKATFSSGFDIYNGLQMVKISAKVKGSYSNFFSYLCFGSNNSIKSIKHYQQQFHQCDSDELY